VTGVVFDFGNVLYHFDYRRMARELAGEAGFPLLDGFVGSPLQIAYETGRANLEDVLAGFSKMGFPVSRERFLEAFLAVFDPVEGMASLVETLAARRPLGLLSNTCPEHARLFIETVPEMRHIPARVYSFEVGHMKPHPEIYLAAARAMALPPEELVFTDDIPDLAAAAEAVGMTGIPFHGAADLARHLAGLGFTELIGWEPPPGDGASETVKEPGPQD